MRHPLFADISIASTSSYVCHSRQYVQLGPILDISDALVFLSCVPNILGLYFLAPIVKKELDSYMARLKSGEIKKFK